MKFLVCLLSLVVCAEAKAGALWEDPLQCPASALFRFSYAGQKIEEPAALCFNGGRSVLISRSCEAGRCEALSENICKLPPVSPASFEGPGLCDALGGLSQIGAFFDGKEWWDMDRCFFGQDRSFVDTGVLAARRAECFHKEKLKP
jgi:hypothetical protein